MAAPAGVRVRGERSKFYEGLVEELLTFAEHQFKNNRVMPDGASEGDHRASAARQFAKLGLKLKTPIIVETPPMPELLRYLWGYFCEVSLGMAVNGIVPPVVTWEGLLAWAHLQRIDLDAWEARAIVTLGTIRASILSEKKPH